MMSPTAKPDCDSLMALQALLKIRSDSVISEQDAFGTSAASNKTNDTTRVSATKNEKPLEKALNNVPAKQQGPNLLHVTPPFGAMSPRSALSPSFTLNYDVHQSNDAPFSPVVPPPSVMVNPVAVPSSGAVLQPPMASGGGQVKQESDEPEDATESNKPVVRATEIQAALRSKPQRGRKRDNLSELERLELTRTRNREHAKSTRIRKKARHQELLDNEQKYQELQKIQDLCKKRSECVYCFLSVRESMLRTCLDERVKQLQVAQSPARKTTETKSEQGLVTPQRSVKFVQFSMANQSFLTSPGGGDDKKDALHNVVDSEFEFSSVGGTLVSFPGATQGSDAMQHFDKALATRVDELLGKSFVKKLSYTVAQEGIAVNDQGTGFAQVKVVAKDGHQELKLVTAILKLRFVPNSTKLKSVMWHTTGEPFEVSSNGDDSDSCPSSDSGESLGCQTSFPSVVSLDQSGDAGEQKPPAESSGGDVPGPGPGMNI